MIPIGPIAEAAGAVVKTVVLEPPHWRLTEEALAAAVTDKTAAIVVNTPLNPIGRVFDRERDGGAGACRAAFEGGGDLATRSMSI